MNTSLASQQAPTPAAIQQRKKATLLFRAGRDGPRKDHPTGTMFFTLFPTTSLWSLGKANFRQELKWAFLWHAFPVLPSGLTWDCILNLCDVGKMRRVGNAQASHPVSVSPLLGRRGKRSVSERECHFIRNAKDYKRYVNIWTGRNKCYQHTNLPVLKTSRKRFFFCILDSNDTLAVNRHSAPLRCGYWN